MALVAEGAGGGAGGGRDREKTRAFAVGDPLWYCTILIRVSKSRTFIYASITSTWVSDKNNCTLKTWKKKYSLPRLSYSLG